MSEQSTVEDDNPYGIAPFAGQPSPEVAYRPSQVEEPPPRPGVVTAGAVIAIVMSGIVAAGALLMVVVFAVLNEDALETDGFEMGGEDRAAIIFFFAMFAVLAGGAIVLAAYALKRSPGARLGLLLLGFLAVAIEVLLGLSSIVSEDPVGTTVAVVAFLGTSTSLIFLLTRPAGRWYTGRLPAGQVVVPFE